MSYAEIRTGIVAVVFAITLVGCVVVDRRSDSADTSPSPQNGAAEESEGGDRAQAAVLSWDVRAIAEGMEIPWDLALHPNGGELFVTERPGRLQLVDIESGERRLVAALPQVSHVGEGGLTGVELHPDFADNNFLYLYYTYRSGQGTFNRISRFTYEDGGLRSEVPIVEGIPGGTTHNGGRLRFGPDGMLWILTGDAGVSSLAQDSLSLAGKILRVRHDGEVPEDNPDPQSPIYSMGHRNPQGLDWHPVTGELYATEHGPVAHDEINRIVPGGNYGWPQVQRCTSGDPRFLNPVFCSGAETWAPSGASFLRDGPEEFVDSFFFAGLRGSFLRRVDIRGEAVFGQETILDDRYGRLRGVRAGPQGVLFVTTSNRDGRGRERRGDDRILLVRPVVSDEETGS